MKKTKTSWNLSLYYKNEKDPQIEEDIRAIEKSCANFEKKYRNAEFTLSVPKLLKALGDYEQVLEIADGHKPWSYFTFRTNLNSNDDVAKAMSTKTSQRITTAFNKLKFFKLRLTEIPKVNQKELLGDKRLVRYRYYLELVFVEAQFSLSEGEEQLMSLMKLPSKKMWIGGLQKILNQRTVSFKGKELPLSEATSILSEQSKKDRQILWKKIMEQLVSLGDLSESEINAVYTTRKIEDERRGHKEPHNATLLNHENDEKTINGLVDVVTKNFGISHRFYKLHSRLLGEKKITYADRSVKIGKLDRKFGFDMSAGLVRDALAKVDEKYAVILDQCLGSGQIDAYPKKGKRGGAFCAGRGKWPTMVLLNHTDNFNSLTTFAHEMGHAIHTELSKSQPVMYRDYTISVAEVASTFFEQVLLDNLESQLTDDERIVMLHNKIVSDVSNIFRQIACFNFELELHRMVREQGEVSKEGMAKLMAKHMRSYLGNSVEFKDEDGYIFVSWPHIRNFFYVYSYAYGQLISRALFEKWKEDPTYDKKIEQFLSVGGSMSPKDIFKSIGIDTTDPKFFETGLKAIERDIEKLEKLTRKVSKPKKSPKV
jgi:oligoendopeptidase F